MMWASASTLRIIAINLLYVVVYQQVLECPTLTSLWWFCHWTLMAVDTGIFHSIRSIIKVDSIRNNRNMIEEFLPSFMRKLIAFTWKWCFLFCIRKLMKWWLLYHQILFKLFNSKLVHIIILFTKLLYFDESFGKQKFTDKYTVKTKIDMKRFYFSKHLYAKCLCWRDTRRWEWTIFMNLNNLLF